MLTVAFTRDGNLLASGGRDKTVHLWSTADAREVGVVEVGAVVSHVVFSSDGHQLVTACANGAIKVWDVDSRRSVGSLAGHEGDTGAAYCGNGDCIVTWDDKGHAAVWDAHTLAERSHVVLDAGIFAGAVDRTGAVMAFGTEAGRLEIVRGDGTRATGTGHDQPVYDVALSPDETTIVTASLDGTARLWDAKTATSRAILAGHRANLTTARFSPAGDVVVTASADGTARMWSATSGTLLGDLGGHSNIVFAIAFSPDGRRLVTASWDHRAIVWDLAKARQFESLPTMVVDTNKSWPKAAFSHDGTKIAAIGPQGVVTITGSNTQPICHASAGPDTSRIAWSADATWIATADGTPTVRVFDAASCKLVRELAHPANAFAIAFGAGDVLFTGAHATFRSWHVATGQLDQTYVDAPGLIAEIVAPPEGDRIVAITDDPAAVIIQGITGAARRQVLVAGQQPLTGLELDPGRHRIMASGFDQYVWTWDDRDGALVDKLEGTGPLWGVRASADGALLVAVGGLSPTVWDATTRTKLGTLDGHSNLVVGGGFIADRIFVTVSRDGSARVWDLTTFHPLITFRGAQGVVISADHTSVIFSDVGGAREWSPRFPPVRDLLNNAP